MFVNAVLATEAQINKGLATGTKNVQIFIDNGTNVLKALYPDGTIKVAQADGEDVTFVTPVA